MKIGEINITVNDIMDDELNGHIYCPHCRNVWLSVENGVGTENSTPCHHLKFVWYQETDADQIRFFNDGSLDALIVAAKKAFKKVYHDDFFDYEHDDEELLLDMMFDDDVWAKLKLPSVDQVLTNTIGGIGSCGLQSYSVLYGISSKND